MFIDEKGKIFGKINLIDLIILVVIVAAVVFVGFKFLAPAIGTTQQEYYLSFYAEEVNEFVPEKVNIGDMVFDETKNQEVGTVTEIDIANAVSFAANTAGAIVQSSKPGYKSLTITSEVKAQKDDYGIIVGTARYNIGHSLTLYVGDAKIYMRVSDIKIKE